MSVLIAILGISALIFLHELGHFAAARLAGMHVARFSVGLGPTVLSRKAFGTEWQIGLIPLGGYVLIAGMDASEPIEDAAPDAKMKRYLDASLFERAGVIAAGPVANFLVAAVLLAAGGAAFGFRELPQGTPTLDAVTLGDAAFQAGLREGDVLIALDKRPIESWNEFVATIRRNPQISLALTYQREGKLQDTTLVPKKVGEQGQIGASPRMIVQPLSLGQSFLAGATKTWHLTEQQGRALIGALTGHGNGQLAGLPAIVRTLSGEAKSSFGRLLESLAYLSVGLGLINLAPFPALDGGRLVFLAVEAIRRRPASAQLESFAHTAGFVVLLGLMAFVSLRDLVIGHA